MTVIIWKIKGHKITGYDFKKHLDVNGFDDH